MNEYADRRIDSSHALPDAQETILPRYSVERAESFKIPFSQMNSWLGTWI